MEYFSIIKQNTTEQEIQRQMILNNLGEISTDIFCLDEPNEHTANIGGIWGEFTLVRTELKGGVRFVLAECPNALCWTITAGYEPAPEAIVIHMTINRQEIKDEFNEELTEFLETCLIMSIRFSP